MTSCSYDWIKINQDFGSADFPPVSAFNVASTDKIRGYVTYAEESGDILSKGIHPFSARGSYDTSVRISVRGSRITLDGNVSRLGRLDNLNGINSIDALVNECNQILTSLHPDLPKFTKCTKFHFLEQSDDTKSLRKCSDGAIINRLDICSNSNVGKGNVDDYLRALSMLPYRNLKPHLYANGKTVDWLKNLDSTSASTHLYPKVYDKAHDIKTKSLDKAVKALGPTHDETKYLQNLYDYCVEQGVARHEIEFKSKFLSKHDYQFYGLFDENELKKTVNDFIKLDEKAGGNAMSYETLVEKLVSTGACKSYRSASTTMGYYDAWRAGRDFKCSTISFNRHRAALRKVGIDIAIKYDQSKVVDLFVKESRTIIRQPLALPSWYRNHSSNILRSVGA